MKSITCLVMCLLLLTACDKNRVFEENYDFQERAWLATEQPAFEFYINNADRRYNLYANLRNEVSYPYSRLFFTYYLTDSSGVSVKKELVTQYLFDKKTGKPFGTSGLGDLYDHQVLLLKDFQFKTPGKYMIKFEQFMRLDTLPGVVSTGVRIEHAPGSK